MFARLGLLQVKLRPPCDDLKAVIRVALEEVLEVQDLRASAIEGEHDCAEGRLELRVLVEVVQNDLSDGITFQLHDDAHIGL